MLFKYILKAYEIKRRFSIKVAMKPFQFTHAIVRYLPNSYENNCLRSSAAVSGLIDMNKAREQHNRYCLALEESGVEVIKLPIDEKHPDSVFVEDTAVICNGTALITRPGNISRRKEVDSIKPVLREYNLKIAEIVDTNAIIDGGDVLFTGFEFFVGQSERTNEAGAKALARAFPDFIVTPINVSNVLHLKTWLTVVGPGLLAVGSGKDSQDMLKQIQEKSTFQYKSISIPYNWSANCVYVNDTLLHAADDIASVKIFEQHISHQRKPVYCSEINKGDGSLTCLSLLF